MQRKPPPQLLTVVDVVRISPNFIRITFGGENLTGFSPDCTSANIKLLLPAAGQNWNSYLQALNGVGDKPIKRTYTVREVRVSPCEVDVDFALHANPGPATQWALAASVGEQIGVAGPGTVKHINRDADWFLLAADASALPALSANLAKLPVDAQGYAVIEITDSADKQTLSAPEKLIVRWVINADPQGESSLAEIVKSLPWLEGQAAAWIAGETTTVRELRRYLAQDRGIPLARRYTSGYWHIGHTEDSFQPIKRGENLS